MICLRCGWCCRNIWPGNKNDDLDVPVPCPHLIQPDGQIATCDIYATRPQQCINEHMGVGEGEYCPIGLRQLERGKIPRPIGRCIACGQPFWSDTYYPHCSESCGNDHIADLNAFIKRGCKDD